MRLRNKRTGEIGYIEHNLLTAEPQTGETLLTVRYKDDSGVTCYKDYATIKFFNEQWEDYKPAEPLIKDEKIRKAVRAWAEAVGTDSAFVEKWAYDGDQFVLSDELAEIHFRITTPKEIKTYKRYTIAELCGEEE